MPFEPAAVNTNRNITPEDLRAIRVTLDAVNAGDGRREEPRWGTILGIDGRAVGADGSWPGFDPAAGRQARARTCASRSRPARPQSSPCDDDDRRSATLGVDQPQDEGVVDRRVARRDEGPHLVDKPRGATYWQQLQRRRSA